jgi:putative oxygen-independent coproporphyrinogen III oxidase
LLVRHDDRFHAPPARRARPSPLITLEPFGVYVHIPFCAARCDYCAFATWTDRLHLQEAYAAACIAEIRAAASPTATSVFFGGGTPSLMEPSLLVSILDAIDRRADAEVTIECNPESVTERSLDAYRAGGVNRVSFGVQSMADHVLASLGRAHARATVERAVAAARAAGFTTWNADLIFGAAGESIGDWRRTLEATLALDPPHVSAYGLTVEQGTPLARDRARHPDDDDLADKYALADEMLIAAGRQWYEVSNWAVPGHECRHNRLYWAGGSYRGIGCAAHSFDGERRWWNVRTPERFIERIAAGRSAEDGDERLDPSARRVEALTLRLRTRDGVPVDAISTADRDDLEGLIELDDDRVVLTRAGRLLANEVALRLR